MIPHTAAHVAVRLCATIMGELRCCAEPGECVRNDLGLPCAVAQSFVLECAAMGCGVELIGGQERMLEPRFSARRARKVVEKRFFRER